MNTQAHVMLSHLVLGRKVSQKESKFVFLGALLPDLPMFWFLFYEKVIRGQSDFLIWTEHYYHPLWQGVISLFNSAPIVLIFGLVSWLFKRREAFLLFLSMEIHVLADLFSHHSDAHRHFYPFSDYKFKSPVSYWEPGYFGTYFSVLEIAFYCVCGLWLWRELSPRWGRLALVLGFGGYIGTYLYFSGF